LEKGKEKSQSVNAGGDWKGGKGLQKGALHPVVKELGSWSNLVSKGKKQAQGAKKGGGEIRGNEKAHPSLKRKKSMTQRRERVWRHLRKKKSIAIGGKRETSGGRVISTCRGGGDFIRKVQEGRRLAGEEGPLCVNRQKQRSPYLRGERAMEGTAPKK